MMDEVEARDEVSSSSSCQTPTESSLSLKLRNQEGVCQEKDCITSNDIRNESGIFLILVKFSFSLNPVVVSIS